MNRNLRTIITDKDDFLNILYENGVKFKFKFRPFLDLLSREELIRSRKLPDGRTKYYIKTNAR